MTPEYLRDAAATVGIFGFFAMVWFGWAQEAPPRSWRRWLVAGSVVSVLLVIAGVTLYALNLDTGTAFDRDTSIHYGVAVGIEFALAGIGAVILGGTGRKEFIPVLVGLIVGIHFFPLAVILNYPVLHVIGALATGAAAAAVPLARRHGVAISAVTGVGMGISLLLGAFAALAAALTF
ncbi:hypothetical protein [Rhizomonospora bruguierae]|uniref:hypothetical protein n=1 Tax=Rhizomonospora bruguierae TaxID=1581705 RepID=UPI001BCB4B41|nr:hypothetical protein [Micromonospora sp. NBRC 107566]